MAEKRYEWIDAARGYGALMVVMCHLIQRLQFEDMIGSNGVISYLLNGARAVQLFFVVSGMVAFLSFRRVKWGGYPAYIKKKYLRLFPAYILMICFYYVIGSGKAINSFSDSTVEISPFGIILNLLGLHGFSPKYINTIVPGGWYVGIIWIYFLIAPLLYKIIRSTSMAVKCMFLGLVLRVVCHIISGYFIENTCVREWLDMFIINQFLFLAIGQLLYFCLIKKDMTIHPFDQLLLVITVLYVTFQVDTLALWALIFVIIMILLSNFKNSLFVNHIALWFGKYSYEIYLCHVMVQYYMCKSQIFKFNNMYLTILFNFVVCVIITSLVAVLVNKSINVVKIKILNN